MSANDTATPMKSQARGPIAWTNVLIFLAICTVGGVWLHGAWSALWEVSHKYQCANNLKHIGVALHAYHDQYGSFPPSYLADPDGKRLHSWRALILPFLDEARGQQGLSGTYSIDEAWDGPNNYPLANEVPRSQRSKLLGYFHCWGDPEHECETSYLAVIGPDTVWPAGQTMSLSQIPCPAETIMLVEVIDSGVKWSEPKDLPITEVAKQVHADQHNDQHERFVNVLYADGSVVYFFERDLEVPEFIQLLLVNGKKSRPDGSFNNWPPSSTCSGSSSTIESASN